MEGLGGTSSSSTVSTAIIGNANKGGTIGLVKLSQRANRFLSLDVGRPAVLEQSEEATLPPLVFQFDSPGNECVIMAMLTNGKPEVVKNEEGSETTSAFAGFIDGKGLVYGAESKAYRGPREVWQCVDLLRPGFRKQYNQSFDLEGFGLFTLPRIFFVAYLIRKLKVTAEAQRNGGGFCQVAIMTVPLRVKCATRLQLKEAAALAGFKDVFVTSSEGLAAYYWFSENKSVIEQNNYSRDTVIIDLFQHAVVYKMCVECDVNGKEEIVVNGVLQLDNFSWSGREEDEFNEMLNRKLNIDQMTTEIPVLNKTGGVWSHFYVGTKYANKVGIARNDESDDFMYFAAKGAALLSENPDKIGRRVRNMIETTVMLESECKVVLPFEMLPETCVRLTCSMKHSKVKYRMSEVEIAGKAEQDRIGYLAINGVKVGAELEVSFEVNWEGIWEVVGVSTKNGPSEDQTAGGYTPVKWELLSGEKAGFTKFGCSSYEECRSLLLKIAPSPSRPQVVSTAEPTQNGSPIDLLTSLDDSVPSGPVCGDEIEEKKKWLQNARAILPNEMIMTKVASTQCRNEIEKKKGSTKSSEAQVMKKTGSKKMKLASGLGEAVVKTEQDSLEANKKVLRNRKPKQTRRMCCMRNCKH